MKLYFLRHGLANRNQWGGSDEQRPLTEKGRDLMKQEAQALIHLNLILDVIITSPYIRALQTAQIIAEGLSLEDKLIEDERLCPGFSFEALKGILQERDDDESLLFVGHEPDFSITIGRLIGNGRVIMKKGSMARIDLCFLPSISGELVWLVTPSMLCIR